jgi:hypothetical protein
MNLATLVERACLESGYNDTDDVAAAAKFARHWDEHIWNAALWKDALVACDVAVTPGSNDDHAEGIVFLPEVIDRVVAVRTAANQILVQGQEHHYRMDYDSFTAEGAPVEFHILPPAWFTWHADADYIYIRSRTDADAEEIIHVSWVDGLGRKTTQTFTIGSHTQLAPETPPTGKVTVLRVAKPTTTAPIAVYDPTTILDDQAGNALVLSDDHSPLYQRLRLLPIPTADLTLKVLGKAKCEPLEFDQQEPALRNCTNALLAYIRGSLKRRGGENGAAQLEFAEANALLEQVKQIEALQAANNQRFLPEAGYGPEHGLGPMGIG